MRILALCLVKNEADIIAQTLRAALQWCDRIGIVDNGSTDDTYAIAQRLANEFPKRIMLCGVEQGPFRNDLRRIPYEALSTVANPGDWWCRLDADEFYPQDPRTVLLRAKRYEAVVYSIHLQYYYTDKDFDHWKRGEESVEDRARPIQERRRYYSADFSEIRFFKHRDRMKWRKGASWPTHLGVTAQQRVLVQHYKFRDPEQIKVRLGVRKQAFRAGHHNWSSDDPSLWMDHLRTASSLHYDRLDGRYVVDSGLLPVHMEPVVWRLAKRAFHGVGIWP